MNKYEKFYTLFWNIVIMLLMISALASFAYYHATSTADYSLSDDEIYDWSEDWTVSYGNVFEEKISLPAVFPVERGSAVILKKKLPEKIKKYNCVLLTGDRQDVNVHVGGVMRTSYSDIDTRVVGNSSPSSLVLAPIYSTDEGADISILISTEAFNELKVEKVYIGNEGSLIIKLIKNNIPLLVFIAITFLVGFVSLITYFTMGKNFDAGSSLIFLFWAATLASIWSFSQLQIRQMFVKDIAIFEGFAYCCLMLSIIPLGYIVNYLSERRYKTFFKIGRMVSVLNFIIQTFLSIFDIKEFFQMQYITNAILLLATIIAVVVCIMELARRKDLTLVSPFIALIVFFAALIADFATPSWEYTLGKYYAIGVWFLISTIYIYIVISAGREQKRKKDAEHASVAKSQFLATMSHEIRTPINAVLGMNEMILRDSNEEKIRGYATDVEIAGKSLLSLVNDILDFSKIEAGKMDIINVNYQMRSLLQNLILVLQGRIAEKGLLLKVDIDHTMPSAYYGDEVRIKQILTNILTNAAKYTEKGTITFTVKNLGIEAGVAAIYFSVKDTGRGIKEEDIAKLMSSDFIRVDQVKNRNVEGTGLGISITRQLLALMDSELKIDSEYGMGSDFHFVLKQRVVDDAPMGEVISSTVPKAEKRKKRNTFTAPNARILAVDDIGTNLMVIKGLLRPYKINVTTCESGDECIQKCREEYFDLIFMDHMMPGKDGIETLKELKADDTSLCRSSKVIVFTANAISGVDEMYKGSGFDGYMTKPVDINALDACMRNMLPKDYIIMEESE